MSLDASIALRLGSLELAVSIEVAKGEVLAILGPNGAGKSTVLRALAGLNQIDSGFIRIDGTVMDDPDADVFVEPERRPIGFVFQDYLLFEHMTVLDNVAFGLRARGRSRRDARSEAHEWVARLGLADHASHRPGSLSGGQAQRVALARALAVSPRLLLLDEPLAALDVGTRTTVRRELRQHLGTFDGMRVLVTHDPVDAYALADRVAIVESGRVVQSGSLADVTAHPRSRYVADLVGVNLLQGTVRDGALTTNDGTTVIVADAEPGPSYLVIRPHSITLTRTAPNSTSARNTWPGTVVDIDRLGDRARVRLQGPVSLTAEITIAALHDLDLRPGDDIHATVKATDIEAAPA